MMFNEDVQAELIKIGAHYLNITIDEFKKRMVENPQLAIRDWEKREDINTFYGTTEAYIYGLVDFCSTERLENITFPIRQARGMTVLDYGSGIGVLPLFLKGTNKVYYYDLPSKTQDFAKYIHKNLNSNVEFLEKDNVFTRPYDLIICLDTLEHLEDPMEVIRAITENLRGNGLFFTTGLDFSTNQPMHLKSNIDKKKEYNDYMMENYHLIYFNLTPAELIYLWLRKGAQ